MGTLEFASAWQMGAAACPPMLEPKPYTKWAELCWSRDCALTPLLESLNRTRLNSIGSSASDSHTREFLRRLGAEDRAHIKLSDSYFRSMRVSLDGRLREWY